METARLVIRPLSPFGAEVSGVDLGEELPPEITRALRDAWHKHSLLVFHDQELTKEQQLRVVTIFGKVTEQGTAPGGVNFITNVYDRGLGNDGEMNLNTPGELRFHLDHTFHEHPLRGIMLYAIEVPPPEKGGATMFSDTRQAYKLLPDGLRHRIAGLKAHYKVPRHTPDEVDERAADHPLVFTHPETGETLLFLSRRHADHIIGLDPAEGEALMDELSSYIERPEIVFRHEWAAKDLVVLDNLALQHARETFDPSYRRHLRRTQIG